MNTYRKSLIRHCEVFGATAATAVATQGHWWPGRTSHYCRGRLRLPRKDAPVGVHPRAVSDGNWDLAMTSPTSI